MSCDISATLVIVNSMTRKESSQCLTEQLGMKPGWTMMEKEMLNYPFPSS